MNDFYVVRLRKIIAQCFPIAIDLYDDASFDDNTLPWKFPHQILDRIDKFLQSICVFIKFDKHPSMPDFATNRQQRSEEHTSELQSPMRISYAVFCLKKKHITNSHNTSRPTHTEYIAIALTLRITRYIKHITT